MRWRLIGIGAGALVVAAGGALCVVRWRAAAAKPALSTPKEKLSYTAGVFTSRAFKDQGVDIDIELAARGLKDAFSGQQMLMSEDALRETVGAYQEQQKQKQVEAVKKVAEDNQKTSQAFLDENAKAEGVVSLPSGLQYKIVKAGQGKRPTETDTVECQYRGIRIDGKEFQSSYTRGQPAKFAVASVIPGLQEALKLMPVGSNWKLFVPPQLAYGERGAPGRTAATTVGPNEALIFDLELLAIKQAGPVGGQPVATKAKSGKD
jgi:FKBP-type peptidyl-prolyl cis-trans isomerase